MLIKYIVWRINSGVNSVTDDVNRDGILVVLWTPSYTSKPNNQFWQDQFYRISAKIGKGQC